MCSLCFRAIYFAAYSKSKEMFNGLFVPNSGVVHMSSAGVAGEQSACQPLLHKCNGRTLSSKKVISNAFEVLSTLQTK